MHVGYAVNFSALLRTPALSCKRSCRRGDGQMCSLTIQVQRVRIPAALMRVLIEAAKLMSEEYTIDVSPADEEVSAGGGLTF